MSKDRGRGEGFDSLARRLKRPVEAERGGRRSLLSAQGAGNTSTPCAACKLLRRRCAQECPFSPYFSPHEPQKFACVHKVFGASNVSKMLMDVPEGQRGDTANSLVYEANARIRDPVYGCMSIISDLQQQAQSLQAQLNEVRAEIMRYRCRENASAAVIQATGFSSATPERTSSGLLSHAPGSGDYTIISPPSTGTSSDTKDRFWSSLN